MKPIAFKVRGGGNYSGTKGGAVKPNEKGGAGYLGYEDKTFTIATSPDQWICTTTNNLSSQPTTMNEPAQPAPVGKPLRYLSVCSGMEAASVAWHPLGWQPVGFSEIEPFPCAILKHRFPNIPNHGSLTEHQTWPIEQGAIDLLVGGTPCQSFSVAGLRKGLADPRGNLALTFLALADRLKPRWIVWENVPGVLSSGGGRDFGSFLGALVELGYGFAYRVLDAQYFGVPQRRRRVFVVACLGDWRAPAEVLSLREGLRGYLEAGGKKRKGVAADAGSGVAVFPINTLTLGGRPDPVNDRRMTIGVGADGDPQFTLQAAHSHAVATAMAVRRLTPVECERLQGFPDNWSRIPWKGKPETECPDGPRYKACGNSMAVPVMRWIGERIAAVETSSYA